MLAIDVETTTSNKGSPFDPRNILVTVSICNDDIHEVFDVYRYPKLLDKVREICDNDRYWITFNGKFDIHWLRKAGINPPEQVWDVQLFEFFNSHQTWVMPSLNGVCEKWGRQLKPDKIAEYWENNVDTLDIPVAELYEYALHDTRETWELFKLQIEQSMSWSKARRTLFNLQNQDLLVLEEMEFNGMPFDRNKSLKLAEENDKKIEELQKELNLCHNVPNFNWASNDHLSCLLYGGTILEKVRVPIGFYKTGSKQGEPRNKIEVREYKLPRRYKPLRGSELKKEGYYSVDEKYLSLFGKGDKLIEGILEVKKLNKDNSTYLRGLPELQDSLLQKEKMYGTFNQCIAATGRLSSARPNLQNLSQSSQSCFVSSYREVSSTNNP